MAKVKLPLELADGTQARTIEKLREHFDLPSVLAAFLDERLLEWLSSRYYEQEAEQVSELSSADPALSAKLCAIFGAVCEEIDDPEELACRKSRLDKLRQYTEEEEILRNIELVAFDQEELAERYDEQRQLIYLCAGPFSIPKSKQTLQYVKIGNPEVSGLAAAEVTAQPAPQPKQHFELKLDKGRLHKLQNGTKEVLFSEHEVKCFTQNDNYVFAANYERVTRIDFQTKEQNKVYVKANSFQDGIRQILCSDTQLFIRCDKEILTCDLDGDFIRVMCKPPIFSLTCMFKNMELFDNKLYVLRADSYSCNEFFYIDLKSNRKQKLPEVKCFAILNSKIYAYRSESLTNSYICEYDLEGKNERVINKDCGSCDRLSLSKGKLRVTGEDGYTTDYDL